MLRTFCVGYRAKEYLKDQTTFLRSFQWLMDHYKQKQHTFTLSYHKREWMDTLTGRNDTRLLIRRQLIR